MLFNFKQKHTLLIQFWKYGYDSSKQCSPRQCPYTVQHISMASRDVKELYANGDRRETLDPTQQSTSFPGSAWGALTNSAGWSMDWEVCSHLSALLAEGHRPTCPWKPMGQLGKWNLPSGIPMPPLPKDCPTSRHVKIVGLYQRHWKAQPTSSFPSCSRAQL